MTEIVDVRPGQMGMLLEGGERYHQMINIGEWNPVVFENTWDSLMRATSSFVLVGLNKETGKVEGGLGCVMSAAHSTSEMIATVGFWFVHPEHRGTLGARLLIEAEQRAIGMGADRINVLMTLTPGTPKIAASLKRHGYRPFEVVYTRLVTEVDEEPTEGDPLGHAENPESPA